VHHHPSLRERLTDLAARGDELTFEPTDDPTLVAFATLVEESGLFAFDANKHQRTDAWSPVYDCWTESQQRPDSPTVGFEAIWAPVSEGTDPLTGFRRGRDSVLLGSTPTVAMPQDERTEALLLLVTTTFVHLSASREGSGLTVRGAVDVAGRDFRYVMLDPARVPAHRRTADLHCADAAGTTQPSK
jgi:hypothetical protein